MKDRASGMAAWRGALDVDRPVTTPCIGFCRLDPATSICRGCGRTLDEITAWGSMTEAARLAVMHLLPRRFAGQDEGAETGL